MHFQLPNAAEGRLGVSASDGWMEAADKAMPSEMSRNDFKTSNHEKKVGSHARVQKYLEMHTPWIAMNTDVPVPK